MSDLYNTKDGLRLRIRASKTDQEQHGVMIAIPAGGTVSPINALKTWLAAARIEDGPVFRPVYKGGRVAEARLSERAVADIELCVSPGRPGIVYWSKRWRSRLRHSN